MRETCVDSKLDENNPMQATFSCLNDKKEIIAMLGTHVDDILWAAKDEGVEQVQKVEVELKLLK